MAKAAQQTTEPSDVFTAEQVAVAGIQQDTSVSPPVEFDRASMQEMISREMAATLATMLPALMPELLRGQQVAAGPSGSVNISMVPESAAQKPGYLKHYRRDDTISGKYQLIDISKLDEHGEIPVIFHTDHNNFTKAESPAIMKGKWIHFVNGHFYATTKQEVDFIEWKMRTDPQFRVYEDRGPGLIACPVYGCTAPAFSDQETLDNHKRATHGV